MSDIDLNARAKPVRIAQLPVVKTAADSEHCKKLGDQVALNFKTLTSITADIIRVKNSGQEITPNMIFVAKQLLSMIPPQLKELKKQCVTSDMKKAASALETSLASVEAQLKEVLPEHFQVSPPEVRVGSAPSSAA